jgi:phosphoglycolate phosphatase-like HAD superfamily hydrolase
MSEQILPPTFPNLQAILFDLDGTLLDTDDQVVARLAKRLRPFLRHRAYPVARWSLMKAETPGNAFVTLLDILGLDKRFMNLTDQLHKRRGVRPPPEFQLIPGVDEMIRSVSATYRLGIVSTRSRYHIDEFLQRFPDIGRVMEVSCGLQDTRRLKPHPAPVRLAARRLGLPVEQCLMVGDTTVDVKSARRAGAWSAAVLCGFGEAPELKRAGANVILDSTADLADFLGPGQQVTNDK